MQITVERQARWTTTCHLDPTCLFACVCRNNKNIEVQVEWKFVSSEQ